jgi:hypothetical protein
MQTRSNATSLGGPLTRDQRDEFLETGVVRIPGLIPRAAAEAMAERIWSVLERRDSMFRDRPETWTKERPSQFMALRKSGAFAEMASAGLRRLLDDFFEPAGWREPRSWGQALVTFPSPQRTWNVPGYAWHLDIMPGQVLRPWPEYVRVFAILAPLAPGGGGTAYVAGSYRATLAVIGEIPRGVVRSAAVRKALMRESPWLAELCTHAEADGAQRMTRLMEAGATVRGAAVRFGEMTGEAGDVVLMHPATLHAPSSNGRATPRLMLAESIYAAG